MHDLSGFDSRYIVKKPPATGKHEHGVSLQLEELQRTSVFDQQLGLYNYGYFSGRLKQEFRRAQEYSLPLSLTLLRIDDFDAIERQKKRAFLSVVVRIITKNVTELDLVSKYKQESQIAITLPLTMAEDADEKAQRIMREVAAFNFHPFDDTGRDVTLSAFSANYEIGMASHEELVGRVESGLEMQRKDA